MSHMITAIGYLAAFGRKIGLKNIVMYGREIGDKLCLAFKIFPLKVEVDNVILYGLFRHRSFLAGLLKDYEPYTKDLLLKTLQEDSLFVDGGAHIGWYTLLAARRLSKGEVLAIEPDPFNFAALAFNCASYTNITLVPKAIGPKNGTMLFYSDYGSIGSSLINRKGFAPKRAIEIEVVTIDTLLAEREARHLLLKLDIEGAEPLALQGMTKTVKRFPRITLIVEHNPQALCSGGFSSEDILKSLWSMGFSVWFIDERKKRLIPISELPSLPKGNLLARKGHDDA